MDSKETLREDAKWEIHKDTNFIFHLSTPNTFEKIFQLISRGICIFTLPLCETGVQSLLESYQRLGRWNLIHPCLTLSIIRYITKVKWSNPSNGVAPSPTPHCRSYWKKSLRVALDRLESPTLLTPREESDTKSVFFLLDWLFSQS